MLPNPCRASRFSQTLIPLIRKISSTRSHTSAHSARPTRHSTRYVFTRKPRALEQHPTSSRKKQHSNSVIRTDKHCANRFASKTLHYPHVKPHHTFFAMKLHRYHDCTVRLFSSVHMLPAIVLYRRMSFVIPCRIHTHLHSLRLVSSHLRSLKGHSSFASPSPRLSPSSSASSRSARESSSASALPLHPRFPPTTSTKRVNS